MKPCRKLLDVMYEQRAKIRARLDEMAGISGVICNQSDAIKSQRQSLESIDHIIDAYIDTWQT